MCGRDGTAGGYTACYEGPEAPVSRCEATRVPIAPTYIDSYPAVVDIVPLPSCRVFLAYTLLCTSAGIEARLAKS